MMNLMVPKTILELETDARKVRKNIIEMIYQAGSGHPGGSLSATDILTALYAGNILKFDPQNLLARKRDHFILSCGHATPAYYAVLAEMGAFNEEELVTLRSLGSMFQGHPSKTHAEFVETSSGSLGQGLSIGVGKALAMKLTGDKEKVVVLSSDGEQNEGSHWEAVMFAAHCKLENLNLIVDQNGMQIGGWTKDVLDTEPLVEKYRSFGWNAYQSDGHDLRSLISTFSNFNKKGTRPNVVICRTIRGKGVSFMEGNEKYHSATLSENEYQRAMEELK
ncbi:MAG: transketolase [Patescibacteria group bacterium]|jgi:transketolase